MTKPEIVLRPASPGDGPTLAALMTSLGYPTSPEQMAARLERIDREDRYATFVAVAQGKILGMIGAHLGPQYDSDAPTGRILALSVDPASQGRGVGSALVERAEAWLRAQGAAAIVVSSRHERRAAHRFYEHLGYAATGLRFRKPL